MNNNPSYMNDVRGTWGMRGFTMGVIVGAGIALLMAPAAGPETRRKIGQAARKLGTDAKHRLDQARHTVDELKDDARAAVEAGREAYGRSRHERTSEGLYGGEPGSTGRPA